ncbi:prolyl endopeptidase-like [Acipenser oxyrinchus oxyrinchus]|uniref:Prolyl endopeptidase n=1 Tax=Acipenser oxyrinchus oxyrinchus TaxID=40147 RepID=A0AAD8LMV7_ACIOX|nr:prolyl endopeptidase-like [Acipenser oxyrinchus oxyrinchus]
MSLLLTALRYALRSDTYHQASYHTKVTAAVCKAGKAQIHKGNFGPKYTISGIPRQCVAAKHFSQDIQHSVPEDFKSQLQKYRTLEAIFRKKLRTAHAEFADTAESPVVHGRNHVYFEEGGCICRRSLANGQGEPQVLLSLGDVAWPDPEGASFQRVRLSPQEKHLAATVRSGRSEEASFAVVRLGSTPAVTHIQTAVFSFEWATDNILFYTSQKNLRSFQVYSLVFGEEQPQRTLVCEEQDPRFFVEVMSSKDKRFLTINCNSKSCSEVHLIECRSPLLPPVLVQPRTAGLIYHVEHSEGQLYILTNAGPAHEYQLMRAPLSSSSLKHWQLLYRPAVNTRVIDMELFEKHCVMAMRGRTQLYLDIIPLDEPAQVSTVKLPHWACALEPGLNSQLSSNTFHFMLSSPAQPPRAFFYSLRENHLYQQQEEQAVACRTDYQTSRIEAQSMDGTAVPMTVIHRRTVEELSQSPLLIHVYGAYGVDLNMAFKPESRVLLDEGWTLAYCHVRGGGELGLGWHAQGRLTQKHRGLEDLQACVLRLFELGVSQPGLSALTGSSAGGVLAGALCNRSPELLCALILQAPFLDVLGAMQDPSLPLTVEEQEEWGDPLTNQEHRESIESYCPSRNIRAQRYPSMLITAYEGDQRVPLPGLLKYISRLRAAAAMHASEYNKTDKDPVPSFILDVQPGSDHFGPTDLEESLCQTARQFAFLYKELGIDVKHPKRKRR